MPSPVTYYRCNSCGLEFASFAEADAHEKKCDRCSRCVHVYYVYGCEQTCDHKKDCKFPNYAKFKAKEE